MSKTCVLALLAVVLSGCAVPAATWKGQVEWPDEFSAKPVAPYMEAGAAIAAAAAIHEMVSSNPFPHLFRGCYSPEQGLDVAVFTGPTPNLYYVVLEQHFSRCGGPRVRVLDGDYIYAVTPQGQVVGKAPPPPGDYATPPPSPARSAPPTAAPPPTAPSPAPDKAADAPSETPPPSETPAPAPAPTPAVPVPGTPPPVPPAEG